jgi:hypothetical protein
MYLSVTSDYFAPAICLLHCRISMDMNAEMLNKCCFILVSYFNKSYEMNRLQKPKKKSV